MKRVLSVMLAVCMSFTLCSFSYATDDFSFASEPPVDYGDPIQETTYYDEELDAEVTERIYFAPAESTMFSEKSGEGWYKNEKTYTGWDNGRKSTTYFVEAYFVWGNGDGDRGMKYKTILILLALTLTSCSHPGGHPGREHCLADG